MSLAEGGDSTQALARPLVSTALTLRCTALQRTLLQRIGCGLTTQRDMFCNVETVQWMDMSGRHVPAGCQGPCLADWTGREWVASVGAFARMHPY